jgi:hypothetical protein
MKTCFLLSVLFSALSFSNSENIISAALSKIIKNFYANQSEAFDVIVYNSKKDKKLNDILDEILRLSGIFPYQMIEESHTSDEIPIDRSAVLLFDTVQSYQEFHQRAFFSNSFHKQFFFMVYILNIKEEENLKLFRHLTKIYTKMFLYETFLVLGNEGKVNLITFETFQKHPNCNAWKEVKVNQFEQATREWKSEEIFRQKFINFNGCEIVGLAYYPDEPFMNVTFHKSGKIKEINGYGATINKVISEALNYKLIFNPCDKNTEEYDKTMNLDFVIRAGSIRSHNQNDLHMKLMSTQYFMSKNQIALIPKSPHYSSLEKLFMPFEIEVWIWLLVTYIVAVLTILVLNFASKKVQAFVYGSNVNSPTMNLVYG